MAVLAGIDEAGFGPLLGPLVVSAAVLRVPEEAFDADLWSVLRGAVTRKPRKRPGTLAIGDSKKLYNRKKPNALQHLERGVLAMLATRGVKVESLRGLLGAVCPPAEAAMEQYPWYAGRDLPLPHAVSATDVALAGNALGAGMKAAGVELVELRPEVVLAGEYNRIAHATHNKAALLFGVNSRLLVHICTSAPPGPLRIHADRHGGRIRYRAPLQRVFARCGLRILGESKEWSGYEITGRRRAVELYFGVEFDRHHLAVALASMVSKYLRELFMELFNRFWAERVDGLAPTAGYYADGRRFLGDIAEAVDAMRLDANLLQRCR